MRTRPGRRGSVIMLLLVMAALAGGCIRVVWHPAPYYKRGPQQAEAADGYLPAGTRVMVFGEKDSYSRVLTFDGRAGHVWKNDLMSLSEWHKQQQRVEKLPDKDFHPEQRSESGGQPQRVTPR